MATTNKGGLWNAVKFKAGKKTWSEQNFQEKLGFLGVLLVKVALMLLLLNLFIISLGLMSNAFNILDASPWLAAFLGIPFCLSTVALAIYVIIVPLALACASIPPTQSTGASTISAHQDWI